MRHDYGAAPVVQFNRLQTTSIAVDAWLQADVSLFEKLLGIGFFHYGPRYWMIGEVTPVKALQVPNERGHIIGRILAEYPHRTIDSSQEFFRVRKSPSRPSDPSEYDSPPLSFAGSGRLDSPGRPVLYGSPDLQVCLHECRVSAEDELFVAALKSTAQLKLLGRC